tara:strand:+ start:679 stop:951 length:273 start_codon:yes stop_codon:yes gene_type:complete
MRKPYNGLLATGSLSQATRDIRDRAECIGWRLFRAGSENRWGLRCLADHSKVVRGRNLKEITQNLVELEGLDNDSHLCHKPALTRYERKN